MSQHIPDQIPAGPFGRVVVIVPALNEADALPKVIRGVPEWVSLTVIADNGSVDGTADVALREGASVVSEPRRGYGSACLAALAALPPVDIVVFMDGDASDDPADMEALVAPIAAGDADFVLGSRAIGEREPGSLTPQQLFGNWLACTLVRWIWGYRFTDLGPFRAIRADALKRLEMADRNYGWTVEMQVRAAQAGLRCQEIPARYWRRIGTSKVSGTIRGVFGAGTKILYIIFREAIAGRRRQRRAETA